MGDTTSLNICGYKQKFKKYILKKKSCIRCEVSGARCQVSHVKCHMSLTPTATATDPPPANSPTRHIRMLLLIVAYIQQR